MKIASFNTLGFALCILVAASLVCGQADVKTTATPSNTPDATSKTPEQKAADLKTANGVLNSVSAGLGAGGLILPSFILKAVADGVGQIKTRRSIKLERDY
ncbi:uncharacterized protein MELLADRAFT_102870 [Melampsora larici-populina 98AG31]|uniref:Secreted protein n=1 Tax=Melampsora larici-populina (strain 98AG31 / pathotype 3-4-7) TaxID=747676 RepID=F4R9N4_MELLP|nr:uncharacterized protein MELLADRAFT_102870 [Melampsora larici-populina 98AG31]EGG11010.1 hypothetical protein MELLADRAFT_102870 [Melampsora larici-populina 98AG31]